MRYLITLLMCLCCSVAWAFPPGFPQAVCVGTGVTTSEWTFEGTAACSSLFSTVYGTTDCDSTAYPAAGTEAAKLTAGEASGFRYNFTADNDEVWAEGAIYRDAATPGQGYVLTLDDGAGVSIIGVFQAATTRYWSVRNYITSTSYNGTTTANGQSYNYFRVHLKRSDTVGEIHLWGSPDGTTWTSQVSQTGIDTSNSTNQYNRVYFGRNAGSNLPEDWYMDNMKVYYSNPGW